MKNTIKVLFWAVICVFAWSPVSATLPSTGQPATLSHPNFTSVCEDFNSDGWNNNFTNGWTTNGSGGTSPLVFEMPYLQEFKYSAGPPVLWESGETLNNYTDITGWSNPTAATAVGGVMVGYYTTWVTPYGGFVDGNRSIYMRPRGGSATTPYIYPVAITTPGFKITGTNPVVSWYETAWWALHTSGGIHAVSPNSDPRILSISENGADWTPIRTVRADAMSYETDVVASYTAPVYDQVIVPLKDYIGKTVYFRFDLSIASGKYVYWIIDNFELKEEVTTPLLSYAGDGNFGNVLASKSSQKIIGISNTGVGLLRIQSAEIIGDPEFTVSSGYSFPVDVKGSGSGWSENPMVTLLNLTVNFNPLAGSDFSAVLRIKYGISEEKVIDIPLTGVGISCSNAIPITDLNCSEGLPVECKKSILGPQDALYAYTALYDQDVNVTSCDPHNTIDPYSHCFDTWLKVYPSSGCPYLTNLLVDNDDQEAGCVYNRASSAGSFHLTLNETVYIYWPRMFPDYANAFDDFVFTITVTPDCKDFKVSIAGDELVYRGYDPMETAKLDAKVKKEFHPVTYLWSTGETKSKIKVKPTVTTEYFVDVTEIHGCSARAVFTVEVEDVRCGNKLDKVLMCSKGKGKKATYTTICVSQKEVEKELKEGSTLGTCTKSGFIDDGTILEIMEPELLVYPNPSNGRVNLELNGLDKEQITIEVRDVLGRMVYSEETINSGDQYLKSIDLDRSGVYFITVKSNTVTLSKQVSVIR